MKPVFSKHLVRSSHRGVDRRVSAVLLLWVGLVAAGWVAPSGPVIQAAEPSAEAVEEGAGESDFLSGVRRLTFEGRRAGEGYFNADGTRMVFQSERDPANPFYQIFVTDLETGDLQQVSPGFGKTTCAWIHPDGEQILFASTHHDEEAVAKQEEELELRATGKQRRYSWDYDPEYELYVAQLDEVKEGTTHGLKRLTHAKGYDAEASFSPDGSQIVFASNRAAFEVELSARMRKQFEIDPAYMIDLYLMDADGTNLRRLTNEVGYDGGPFFSPDGERICWRRFAPDGATAEIYTMRIDGSDVRRLTELNAMSWAPFFHPSGDYLIFTTNKHGFGNFELYLVRADGRGEPVRVTTTEGFDGLPVFLPGGDRLSWTSNRVVAADGTLARNEEGEPKKGTSQIYLADFDHERARRLLGLDQSDSDEAAGTQKSPEFESDERRLAASHAAASVSDFTPVDATRHVDYLTRPELGGRMTGSEGEIRATNYVAAYLESLGFVPAGEDGTFFQTFEFPAGSTLGKGNDLNVTRVKSGKGTEGETTAVATSLIAEPELGEDWTPMAFSQLGKVSPSEVVFAGYGLQVPADETGEEYDSYVHLDVTDKWVMVLRDLPQEITPETRQRMARYGAPRRKATIARDLGARGIIFVAGPTSQVSRELIRFNSDASQAQVSLSAVSIDNQLAAAMLETAGKNLGEQQRALDDGSPAMGFKLEGVRMAAKIDVQRQTGTGRNVIARLPAAGSVDEDASPADTSGSASGAGATPPPVTYPVVMVGAHIDHLGRGGSNSLARAEEEGKIHVGADDNASGVAAMLEIAQYIAAQKRGGAIDMQRDLVVAAWSGEELGLFGSQAFVGRFTELFPKAPVSVADPHAAAIAQAHGMSPGAEPLTEAIAAYLNLDMVGRLQEKLIIQGIGSSPGFAGEVQRRNVPVGLALQLDRTSSRLPTDASALVARQVPILSAFTGAHEDYHTPRDTPEKLNFEGLAKVGRLFGLLTRGFLTAESVPVFELDEGDANREEAPRARLTAYLGTIPDYAAGDVQGLKLSGVSADGPAEKAGLQGGDVIVELAGRKIEDIYDYTYAIEALKIGETVDIRINRDGKTRTLKITPGSRE